MTRQKLLCRLPFALVVALSGCASLDALVTPTSYRPLDRDTVDFVASGPQISLPSYAPQSLRPNQDLPDVEFVVAASGGGQRAAAFTMGALTELEQIAIGNAGQSPASNALREIDYFSTVSGGGWAVGAYLTTQIDERLKDKSLQTVEMQDRIMRRLMSLEMTLWSNCLIEKIGAGATALESGEVTMGSFMAGPGAVPKYPYLFSTATIQTNQAPFIFAREFGEHYKVDSFSFCRTSIEVDEDFSDLPLSVALGTSSSVPGFRHTEADTSICSKPGLQDSFLCKGPRQLDRMILVDGGMYDNLGYKTGIEVLSQTISKRRVMLVVDSNADTELPFTDKTDVNNWKISGDVAIAASLSAGYSTYARVLEPLSEQYGIHTVSVRFSTLAGFTEKRRLYQERYKRDPLVGLDALQAFARKYIACFGVEYQVHDQDDPPKDCLDNNFYRVGLYGKTSYATSAEQYAALRDLGRLAIRIESASIAEALQRKP